MTLNSGVGFLERTQSVGSPPSELVDGHTWFYEVLSPYFMHSVLICTNFNTLSCLYIHCKPIPCNDYKDLPV